MFLPTGEECCEKLFRNSPCKVYPPSGCVVPGQEPAHEPTPADPLRSSCGGHGWHVACCDKLFTDRPCEMYDSVCDLPDAPLSCGGYGWHVHKKNNDGCTDDNNYVEAWVTNP